MKDSAQRRRGDGVACAGRIRRRDRRARKRPNAEKGTGTVAKGAEEEKGGRSYRVSPPGTEVVHGTAFVCHPHGGFGACARRALVSSSRGATCAGRTPCSFASLNPSGTPSHLSFRPISRPSEVHLIQCRRAFRDVLRESMTPTDSVKERRPQRDPPPPPCRR